MQKELDSEVKKMGEVQLKVDKIHKDNSEFFQGKDEDLDDELLKVQNESKEMKEVLQPKIRPLKDWNREL